MSVPDRGLSAAAAGLTGGTGDGQSDGLRLALECPAGCQLYPGCYLVSFIEGFSPCTAAKEIQRLSIPTFWPLAFIDTGLSELL